MKKKFQIIQILLPVFLIISLITGGYLIIKKLNDLDKKISSLSEQKPSEKEFPPSQNSLEATSTNKKIEAYDAGKNTLEPGSLAAINSLQEDTNKMDKKMIYKDEPKQNTFVQNNKKEINITKNSPEKISDNKENNSEVAQELTQKDGDENLSLENDIRESERKKIDDNMIEQKSPVFVSNYSSSSDNSIDSQVINKYKIATVTYFWVGEKANSSNDFIANDVSYWDENWLNSYGGIDDPWDRCGYYPCSFSPKENPFYFALPYGEYNDDGSLKENAKTIPWYKESDNNKELLKNRWLEIAYRDRICYGQWEDVGPIKTDDYDYVFGDKQPSNQFGAKAGLDVSPAIWDCLGLDSNDIANWRFVKYEDVPPGPWKKIITRSSSSY